MRNLHSWLSVVLLSVVSCLPQDPWPPASNQHAMEQWQREAHECRFPRELGTFENREAAIEYLLAQGYRRTWYYDCGERELGYCSPDFTREMPFQTEKDDRDIWQLLPEYPVPFGLPKSSSI